MLVLLPFDLIPYSIYIAHGLAGVDIIELESPLCCSMIRQPRFTVLIPHHQIATYTPDM
uniref:Uncharacterized protein n=1 Tax=Arion vulgaris TaxID=1028688 RepID=A0A0B7B7H6_9EUPU